MVNLANGRELEVVRVGSKSGFWLWRKALYKVFQANGDEPRKLVLTGQFRNHQAALDEARKLQRRRHRSGS